MKGRVSIFLSLPRTSEKKNGRTAKERVRQYRLIEQQFHFASRKRSRQGWEQHENSVPRLPLARFYPLPLSFSCLFLRLARSTFLRFSLLPTFTRCLSPLRRTIFIRDLSVPSSGCVLRDTGRRDGSSLTDAEIKRTTYIAKNLTFNKEQERYLSPAVRTTWI